MAAPTVYRSTDSDAPVLTGVLGSLIALLDAVLVNGYGSKAALGWTKEFSGGYKAVYRPPTGIRLYHRFDNSFGGNATNVQYFTSATYESMTSVDTGAGTSELLYQYLTAYAEGASTVRAWIIIGDNKGFYLFVRGNTLSQPSGGPKIAWYGEGIPLISTDAWFNIITGGYLNTALYAFHKSDTSFVSTGNAETCMRIHRSLDGATLGMFTTHRGVAITAGNPMGSSTLPSYLNYPVDGKLLYIRPYLHDKDSIANIRGHLPGLYAPCHYAGLEDETIYTDGTKQLLYLRTATTSTVVGGVFVDIGEGFR